MNFAMAIAASVIVSLMSFSGAIALALNDRMLKKVLVPLIGLSAGGLMGGAMLHLLPEAAEQSTGLMPYIWLIIGFVMFFLMEKFLFWRHCHEGVECTVHPFVYLNLIGDGIHNFIDGLIMGAAFSVDIRLGFVATTAIIMHEIPQEIGDFGVLVYGGMKKKKALFFNFLSALTAVAGTAAGFFLSGVISGFTPALMPLAAGGFIYIAASDLVPELHKQPDKKISMISVLTFTAGILFMLLLKISH